MRSRRTLESVTSTPQRSHTIPLCLIFLYLPQAHQYRDALRNVSPRLFLSDKHRQTILMAVIEALTDLEEKEGEEEEEKEEP